MRVCIFCGQRANSREHVFAKRLVERSGKTGMRVISSLLSDGQVVRRRADHTFNNFEVRCVCRTCNSGWMNDLEEWFENNMGLLIEPEWPRLAATIIESVKTNSFPLAHWMMKTAATFASSAMKGTMPVKFPADVLSNVRIGALPEGCWVDLAYSTNAGMAAGLTRSFRGMNGGRYTPNQIYAGFGLHFVVQFNHLLLRLVVAPGAESIYTTDDGSVPLRIFPDPMQNWPLSISFPNAIEFEKALMLKTWLDCPGDHAPKKLIVPAV
jgi:hypothetical protein